MIIDFKSFNESSSNVDDKFLAIVDQFYTDFSDIAYRINGLKYNIRLYKSVVGDNLHYSINIIINNYDILNGSGLLDEVRSLLKEFADSYHKGGTGYPNKNEHFLFKFSLSPYSFGSGQKLLYKKGDDSFDKRELEQYLHKLKGALREFKESYDDISKLWSEDHVHDLDLNDILTDEYPFELSFDEININDWVESSITNINHKLGLIWSDSNE